MNGNLRFKIESEKNGHKKRETFFAFPLSYFLTFFKHPEQQFSRLHRLGGCRQ